MQQPAQQLGGDSPTGAIVDNQQRRVADQKKRYVAQIRLAGPAIVIPMKQTTPGSDPIYKRLYAFAEMVEDLLRSLFPPALIDAVDWPSLGRLPAEYVGDDFRRRHGDAVWRVRLRDGDERGEWLYVLVLLEFQSTTDEIMALRVLEYTTMLYRELVRESREPGTARGMPRARKGAAKPGRLPPVLPVVLYNGDAKWRAARDVMDLIAEVGSNLAPYQPSQRHIVLDERHATADDKRLCKLTRAVVLLEQSRTPEDLARVAALLKAWLGSSGNAELKRAFTDWLWVLYQRLRRGDEEPQAPPPELTLEEVAMTLEERVISWREPWIQHGREQGLDEERVLLRRQAEARFGADTAERLFALLRRESDPQRLAAVGVAIVRCETGDDLLQQARRTFPNAHGPNDRAL